MNSIRKHLVRVSPRAAWLHAVLLLASWCAVGIGCSHSLKPRWTHQGAVEVAPELRSIGKIIVHDPPSPFFSGFSLATLPVLSEKFTDELASVIRTAVEKAGGTVGTPGAPDLDVLVEECVMEWSVTGVITSVTKVRLRGRIPDGLGAELVFVGEGEDTFTAISIVVSLGAGDQLNRALGTAVASMIADRKGGLNSRPYEAELTSFQRTLFEYGKSIGCPAFGTGMTDSTSIIADPSRNALAQGVVRGDVVVEWNGITLDGRPSMIDLGQDFTVLIARGEPLKLKLRRDGVLLEVSVKASSDSWRDSWNHAIEREDWREALRILDVSGTGAPSAMTQRSYLHLRLAVLRLLDLRQGGTLGTASLYASVALLNEILDQAKYDPDSNRRSRAFLLETVDFASSLNSSAVVADLTARLNAFDRFIAEAADANADDPPRVGAERARAVIASTGTGFLVSADGAILTAFHVIDGATSIKAIDADGKIFTARIVAVQPDLDMALLEVGLASGEYLPVPAVFGCKSGDQVFTLGFPASDLLGREPKYTDGAISSVTGMRGDLSRLQITVPIQPGSSGGPLINDRGEAVAVVVSTAAVQNFYRETGSLPQSVNFAVRSDLGLPLMRGRAVPPILPAKTRQEAIDRARRCVFFILAE